MKPKTLTFVEQYLDEDPPNDGVRRWRGITAYVGEEWVIRMDFYPKKKRFDEEDHFDFDTCLGLGHSDFRKTKVYGVVKFTKEGAKAYAQEIFDEYVKSLCEKK